MSQHHLPYNGRLSGFAHAMRKAMTPQERKLWYLFLRSYPVKIYRQRIIDSFIADFYCASARLVIEIDGPQHYTREGDAYDFRRTQALNRYGLLVIRFTNPEIDRSFDAVCRQIDQAIRRRQAGLSDPIPE